MKEVLTKNFWLGVKKTFDDAREGVASEPVVPQTAPDQPPAPAATSETKPQADSAAEPETPTSDPDPGLLSAR